MVTVPNFNENKEYRHFGEQLVSLSTKMNALENTLTELKTNYTEVFEHQTEIVNEWWTNNVSRFNIFDENDFRTLSTELYNNGRGNTIIDNYINNLLHAHNVENIITRRGYEFSENEESIALGFEVNFTHYTPTTEEDLVASANFLEKIVPLITNTVGYNSFRGNINGAEVTIGITPEEASFVINDSDPMVEFIGEDTYTVLKKMRTLT